MYLCIFLIFSSLFTFTYSKNPIELPQPAGNYSIGTVTYFLTDINREEIVTADTTDKRELILQIWYPADNTVNL